MSRCFPFPPPGYEKKIRIEEAETLLKEKQKKEKKHKKEKKDKEKREGKEKKDKETSKDRHKERKEKKEKHKDRKDKDRDREKSKTSEDRKADGVSPNLGDKERPLTNTLQNNGYRESKFVEDLARRIRDEEKATESQSLRKIDFPGVSENNISCPVPQTSHAKVDEKRSNAHRNFTPTKKSENAVLRASSCTDQGHEVIQVEKKDMAKKKELQEKNHRRESLTKIDKPLDNEGVKKSEAKNINGRSREEEKTDVISKTVKEKPKFVEGGPRLKEREYSSVDSRSLRVQDFSRAGVKNLTAEGNLGKRKDLETDGLLHENGFRLNKIQRANASPVSSQENGRKLEAHQTHSKPVSDMQGTVCNLEAKEHRINGFIHSQEPKSHSPASAVKVKENGETSAKKRPHSDLKYLDHILNVPKREEVRVVDDDEQGWLFDQSAVKLTKKQRADSSMSLDETLQVWNQALRIDSADIFALPYVTPF